MAFCELCLMENCHHLMPGSLESYERSMGGFLSPEDAGSGPEVSASHASTCANCGKPYEAGTRLKHVLHLEYGVREGGWVATCCFEPILEG